MREGSDKHDAVQERAVPEQGEGKAVRELQLLASLPLIVLLERRKHRRVGDAPQPLDGQAAGLLVRVLHELTEEVGLGGIADAGQAGEHLDPRVLLAVLLVHLAQRGAGLAHPQHSEGLQDAVANVGLLVREQRE